MWTTGGGAGTVGAGGAAGGIFAFDAGIGDGLGPGAGERARDRAASEADDKASASAGDKERSLSSQATALNAGALGQGLAQAGSSFSPSSHRTTFGNVSSGISARRQ